MHCIKQFLDDSYQYKLRLLAQSKSERYEDTIENYKKIFLAHYELVKKACIKSCPNNDLCVDYGACSEVRKIIDTIATEDIEAFFDKLKTIYLCWIDSKTSKAITLFTDLLKNYNLLKYEKAIGNYDVYFKGRISENILTSWDMFHIPFNKRYLIQNQRYSLTGQPMLYIGSSVVDIAKEIEAKNSEHLKISVITFSDNNLKIYDLRSNFNEILDDIWMDKLFDSEISYDKSAFFKMILSSVCSFQKKQELKGFNFCEEYVLPQLLAQVLKIENYDGITYYSTKYYDDISNNDKTEVNIAFKENMAIFTNLDVEHVYDRKLYKKLFISVPIDNNKVKLISLKDLQDIKSEIIQSGKQEKITSAERIFSSFERIYGKMLIDGIPYTETEFGKMHMYEIYTVLNQILVD